ncbi:MAG: hypothetical protein JSS65_06295 [Armatimonadetes bacterium]|nr:hypothetical protein [Armatimonadota bacterium]
MLTATCALAVLASVAPPDRTADIVRFKEKVMRADYAGDLTALDDLYRQGSVYLDDQANASRTRYWIGYAKWRRAINGFNETPTPKWLQADIESAFKEFQASLEIDSTYVESKIAAVSCVGLTYFFSGGKATTKEGQDDLAKKAEYARKLVPDIRKDDPDNPRWAWIWAQQLSVSPSDKGGGRDAAINLCLKSLEQMEKRRAPKSPLEPTWGKPELMMNVAYYYANMPPLDLPKAKDYAVQALKIVPYWHYMKDILLVQIETKIKKGT